MKALLKKCIVVASVIADFVLMPFTVVASAWLKHVRRIGVHKMKVSRLVFEKIGVFPIRDHYYEPLFQKTRLRRSLRDVRPLPGVDLNVSGQLALLEKFHFQEELLSLPLEPAGALEFCYHNGAFESGDAEFLYNVIRLYKPKRLIEIGSGHSTRMAVKAIAMNRQEDASCVCEHTCIEPYEQPWLEQLGITVVRKPAEEVDKALFASLGENDILFIDSSHIIRPQGDVLFEYLEVLPTLRPGVLVHVHDIFTPRDYLDEWVVGEVKFWNEQYLLEAFLTCNREFRVIGALNFLFHHHPDQLGKACPVLASEKAWRKPGSFWMVRNSAKDGAAADFS